MLDILAIFAASFGVGLSGALSPGPLLAFTIRDSTRRGLWAGPLVSSGHALLELATVALLALGVGRFIAQGSGFIAISLLGGAMLLWMGWGMVRKPGVGAPSTLHAAGAAALATGARTPLLGGVFVSLANPYWALWWATIGVGFMAQALDRGLGLAGLAAFYLGHISADYAWYTTVAAAVASGRRLMTDTVYKGIVVVCGLFLWAMAVYFLASGLRAAL